MIVNPKGIPVDNEFTVNCLIVRLEGLDHQSCLTRCVQGHYRSSEELYACLLCTLYSAMLLLAQLEQAEPEVCVDSQYSRFQACNKTSDAVSIPCSKLDYNTVLGNALGFCLDCPRDCVTGSHLQIWEVVPDTVSEYSQAFCNKLLRLQNPIISSFS